MAKYMKIVGLVILSVFLACSNSSDESAGGNGSSGGGNGVDISGRWYVEVSFNNSGNANPYVADIQQSDTTFTGTIAWGVSYVNTFSGLIEGTTLNFASSDDTLHFTGSVESADSISGTWYNKFTSDSGTWFAIRPIDNYNIEGEYTGTFYFVNGTNMDSVPVQNGVWKGKAFKTNHGDTTYFAGEMLSVADRDTVSALVPMGGFYVNTDDTLFINFGCTINNINGGFNFIGKVSGDSASGEWSLAALSGPSLLGNGDFKGNVSGIK